MYFPYLVRSYNIINDIIKFLPGDAHPVESPISSMSGSSSPLSAVCDPTTSSSPLIRSSMDSISKASGQKLSAGSDSTSEGQSFQLNRCVQMKEKYWCMSDCEDLCREKYSSLSTPNAQYQCCFITGCDPSDPEREQIERSEQTSTSTVSKPTSPVSDESYGKRPVKRLKADVPNLVDVNQVESPKEQKPLVNESHACGQTVQQEITESPTKLPCSSLGDINADTDNMLEQGSEDVHNMEIATEELPCVKGDIEMTAALDQTASGINLSLRRKRGASILYTLTAEELRDHMSSLINQDTCLVSE